jgi:phenylacetate-coenzyme A ligase PaaK-like adenylate-forming protein
MSIGLRKEIMPHVRFETRDYGRNEDASLKAGRHIPNVANFIIITSHGSKGFLRSDRG